VSKTVRILALASNDPKTPSPFLPDATLVYMNGTTKNSKVDFGLSQCIGQLRIFCLKWFEVETHDLLLLDYRSD